MSLRRQRGPDGTETCKSQSGKCFDLDGTGSHWSSKNQCGPIYILKGAALAAVCRIAWKGEWAEWKERDRIRGYHSLVSQDDGRTPFLSTAGNSLGQFVGTRDKLKVQRRRVRTYPKIH